MSRGEYGGRQESPENGPSCILEAELISLQGCGKLMRRPVATRSKCLNEHSNPTTANGRRLMVSVLAWKARMAGPFSRDAARRGVTS